jgi:hypothetical protein
MHAATLASAGLQLKIIKVREYKERRSEIKLSSTGDIVAFFYRKKRRSAGVWVSGVTFQFIHRNELSSDQVKIIRNWIINEMQKHT